MTETTNLPSTTTPDQSNLKLAVIGDDPTERIKRMFQNSNLLLAAAATATASYSGSFDRYDREKETIVSQSVPLATLLVTGYQGTLTSDNILANIDQPPIIGSFTSYKNEVIITGVGAILALLTAPTGRGMSAASRAIVAGIAGMGATALTPEQLVRQAEIKAGGVPAVVVPT